MHRGQSSLTPAFGLVQAVYWMGFCAAVCFAVVHLQGLGYSYTEIGLVMALGNVLGALAGPVLASAAEKHPQLATDRWNLPLFALRALALLALLLLPGRDLLTSAAYVLYMATAIAVNALNLKFCVDAENRALHLDYGVGRSAGSLAFVVLSAGMGVAVAAGGIAVLPWIGFALLALQVAANALIGRQLRRAPVQRTAREDRPQPTSLFRFLLSQPRYAVFLLGSIILFFAHNASTNFMLNIVQNVGGSTAEMGYLNAFMAAAEIPVMLLFSRFLRGKRVSTLLRASVAVFALKTAAIALAPNLPLLFAAHILQAFSFALYTCAVVPYVSRVIPAQNAAKAQSLAFSTTTLGAVLASLIAGRLYDVCSVQQTMLAALAACAVGVAVALLGTVRTQKET